MKNILFLFICFCFSLASASAEEWRHHKVERGENLSTIEYRYGIKRGMLSIWNPGVEELRLPIGMELKFKTPSDERMEINRKLDEIKEVMSDLQITRVGPLDSEKQVVVEYKLPQESIDRLTRIEESIKNLGSRVAAGRELPVSDAQRIEKLVLAQIAQIKQGQLKVSADKELLAKLDGIENGLDLVSREVRNIQQADINKKTDFPLNNKGEMPLIVDSIALSIEAAIGKAFDEKIAKFANLKKVQTGIDSSITVLNNSVTTLQGEVKKLQNAKTKDNEPLMKKLEEISNSLQQKSGFDYKNPLHLIILLSLLLLFLFLLGYVTKKVVSKTMKDEMAGVDDFNRTLGRVENQVSDISASNEQILDEIRTLRESSNDVHGKLLTGEAKLQVGDTFFVGSEKEEAKIHGLKYELLVEVCEVHAEEIAYACLSGMIDPNDRDEQNRPKIFADGQSPVTHKHRTIGRALSSARNNIRRYSGKNKTEFRKNIQPFIKAGKIRIVEE